MNTSTYTTPVPPIHPSASPSTHPPIHPSSYPPICPPARCAGVGSGGAACAECRGCESGGAAGGGWRLWGLREQRRAIVERTEKAQTKKDRKAFCEEVATKRKEILKVRATQRKELCREVRMKANQCVA